MGCLVAEVGYPIYKEEETPPVVARQHFFHRPYSHFPATSTKLRGNEVDEYVVCFIET